MRTNKGVRLAILTVIAYVLLTPVTQATEVGKEFWMEEMKSALPKTFCQSIHFFRQCFDINEIQCIETASLATKICLHKYINQIPELLQQPKDGARWSNAIGQCAGENFYETLRRKYKATAECDEMNHWQ